MTIPWPAKDPNDVVPCTIDWTDKLAGGVISGTPTWSILGGGVLSLTLSNQSNTSTMTQVTLSGGLPGRTYTLICSVQTSSVGPLYQRATIRIKEK